MLVRVRDVRRTLASSARQAAFNDCCSCAASSGLGACPIRICPACDTLSRMPRRTIYAEVTPDGGLRWQHDEGTIEVLPKIASAVAALEPLTSVEVQCEYRRVDARTRVLKADKLRVGWSPLHRALRAAAEQDHAELERFAQAYAARTDAGGWVLRAARARQAGRDEEAMRCLEEALRAGLSRDINVSTNP